MNNAAEPQSGESSPGMEYPSALAALEDRQIFSIAPIQGGFEIREQGRGEYFVRLLPEQLRELGEEIMAVAQTALEAPAPMSKNSPEPVLADEIPAPPPARGHTITIPSGIWDARVTQEFQARIAKLENVTSPKASTPTDRIKPWIKP
jgi:hypothetical protein